MYENSILQKRQKEAHLRLSFFQNGRVYCIKILRLSLNITKTKIYFGKQSKYFEWSYRLFFFLCSGSKRSNQPMHAVLESSLDDTQFGIKEAQKVRNHALIHYLASLANSNNNEDTFDFDFVESLIVNGADINSTDKSGQTIFHEVARSWNLDVASFLIEHGKKN